MARRKQNIKPIAKRRLTTTQIILYVLSLIIILSMVIGFVISVLPMSTDQGAGTIPAPAPATEPAGVPTSPASGQATPQPGQ
jgi:hypothetical protein